MCDAGRDDVNCRLVYFADLIYTSACGLLIFNFTATNPCRDLALLFTHTLFIDVLQSKWSYSVRLLKV